MCADILTGISLYKNVKITRDYSVVHDMTPVDWMRYLENIGSVQTGDPSPPVRVWSSASVNYYRLPDVIRIEAKYDEIRKATYGMLSYIEGPDSHLYFFWVDSVRLVKVSSTDAAPRLDVVELTVTPDLWSNKFTDCELYDSYVARRHEKRWDRTGTGVQGDPYVYTPRYFPGAADDVGGSYKPVSEQRFKPQFYHQFNHFYNPELCIYFVSRLSTNGTLLTIIGASARDEDDLSTTYPVYYSTYNPNTLQRTFKRLFNLLDILKGNQDFYTIVGVAENIQSIAAVPDMYHLTYNLNEYYDTADSTWKLCIDADDATALGFVGVGANDLEGLMPANRTMGNLADGIYFPASYEVNPDAPAFVYSDQHDEYDESNEPMMFLAPATIRKVVSGLGGSIIDVPDVDAFIDHYSVENVFDFNNASMIVFGGDSMMSRPRDAILRANSVGNMGATDVPLLPIFNSAWTSYQAIQKTGDDIVYNAKQVQAAVGMGTGAFGGLAAGAMTGNVALAGIGAAAGLANGAVNMWSNSENLRARRETVKNSPCIVKSGGSGMAAVIDNQISLYYVVNKLDDVSLEKLRTQYYYYGYNVNMVIPGTIDTKIRKYFDYIETRGARIRGDVNAEEAQGIAAAFDRGVRIYHGAEGYQRIGAGMSLENPERAFLE